MEDYMDCMKILRTQMNDVEDQVAQISVEEYRLIATAQTLQNDLKLAKDEIQLIKEETNEMMKVKGQICTQILEKQRKISSLDSDSTNLNQSLELIRQEKESQSAKLLNRRMHYSKVKEDLTYQLKEQQTWINEKLGMPNLPIYYMSNAILQGLEGIVHKSYETEDSENETLTGLKDKLDAAKLKLNHLKEQKTKVVSDCNEDKKSVDLLSHRITEFKPELRELDAKVLEEEFQAILSDKNVEAEYLQSSQLQISKLKGYIQLGKMLLWRGIQGGYERYVGENQIRLFKLDLFLSRSTTR